MANSTDTDIQEEEKRLDSAIDLVMSHKNRYDIHNKLFDRLFGKRVCQWIETRPDRKQLYQDLFDHAIAEINACNPNQGQEQPQSAPACRSTKITKITLKKKDDITDTTSPCKYLAPYNSFEPRIPGLGIWVLMFLTKEELYDMTPDTKLLDKKVLEPLSTVIPYLNPNFICFRLNYMLKHAETDAGLKFPDMTSAENTVQAWNDACGSGFRSNLVRTFVAVSCFNHFRKFEEAVIGSRLLKDPTCMNEYLEDSACAMFARLDGSPKHKWRKIKNLGANLSTLARNFGGEGFLILFPFSELEAKLGKQLLEFDSTSALWKVLSDLLHSTDMGNFFNSMADSIGVPLINKFYGEPSRPQHEIVEQLGTLRRQYLLPVVSRYTHWHKASVSARQPSNAPFWYCDGPELVHLTSDLSLTPSLLAQIAAGSHLKPEIVEHLIQQQLPYEWKVMGKEDISRPATKELLLCDYLGIMVPLFVNNGWTLFCYTNPIRSEVTNLIKCINPSGSLERQNAALKIFSTWFPTDATWVPQGLQLRSIEQVPSQTATEIDSGIHVIIEAISMAKTGKPESRPLNEQVCKGLRVKYFVHLLNEMQEAANKVAMKNTRGPTGRLPGT